jgi:hypothetical protein
MCPVALLFLYDFSNYMKTRFCEMEEKSNFLRSGLAPVYIGGHLKSTAPPTRGVGSIDVTSLFPGAVGFRCVTRKKILQVTTNKGW